MKFTTLLAAAAIGLSGAAFAQKSDHGAKHGGIFVETKALDFEVLAKQDMVQVYVGEHGKTVKLDGAKGKVTLLNGTEKTEVDLVPVGDRLEAKGSFKVAKGTKGIVNVSLAGKPAATARFEVK